MVGVFAKSPGAGRSAPRRSKNFLIWLAKRDGPRQRNPSLQTKQDHDEQGSVEKKAAHRHLISSDDRVGSKSRISPAAALQGDKPFDSFQPLELPEEPVEHDQPIQCPMPEPSIMEDGILWRARLLESLRRRNDIVTVSKEARESVVRGGSVPTRRIRSRSMENFLLEAHSAPEFEVRKLLE